MEKTATPQAKPKNKHFWNFQPASGDNPRNSFFTATSLLKHGGAMK